MRFTAVMSLLCYCFLLCVVKVPLSAAGVEGSGGRVLGGLAGAHRLIRHDLPTRASPMLMIFTLSTCSRARGAARAARAPLLMAGPAPALYPRRPAARARLIISRAPRRSAAVARLSRSVEPVTRHESSPPSRGPSTSAPPAEPRTSRAPVTWEEGGRCHLRWRPGSRAGNELKGEFQLV